jgi:hypothetical protein
METVYCKLTVFFDDPYWVGVYERSCHGSLEASKVVFGGEPKDYEVYAYFMENWSTLKFSPLVREISGTEKNISPKRRQRQIHHLLTEKGVGTKAQQAIKLQQEQNKEQRKEAAHLRTEERKERQFELRQQKHKEKHRGH